MCGGEGEGEAKGQCYFCSLVEELCIQKTAKRQSLEGRCIFFLWSLIINISAHAHSRFTYSSVECVSGVCQWSVSVECVSGVCQCISGVCQCISGVCQCISGVCQSISGVCQWSISVECVSVSVECVSVSVECVSGVCQWSVSVEYISVSVECVYCRHVVYGLRVRERLGLRNSADSLSPFRHYCIYIYKRISCFLA